LSFAFGADDGLALLSLKTGTVREVRKGAAHLATFSPDGKEVVYANDADELAFVSV